LHGGLLALPALATIGIPVFLDVPEIGVVSIDEAAYAAIYPLLTSENEDDRERAFVQLREKQRERAPVVDDPTVVDTADVPPSAYERGKAALDRGEFDAAIAEFTAAIAGDPKDTFFYIRRGTAYEKKGDAASAIGDYRKVLKLVDADIGAPFAAKIRKLEKTKK
jgi:Flp pilus assembly protein TadD